MLLQQLLYLTPDSMFIVPWFYLLFKFNELLTSSILIFKFDESLIAALSDSKAHELFQVSPNDIMISPITHHIDLMDQTRHLSGLVFARIFSRYTQ